MTTEERIRRLKVDGFCVIEGVIPNGEVDQVRQSVVEAQSRRHAEAEAELAATRARGHRVGVMGVGNLRQVINETQAFAPYLAFSSERLHAMLGQPGSVADGGWSRSPLVPAVVEPPRPLFAKLDSDLLD